MDPSRRLARVDWRAGTRTRVASGNYGAKLWRATLNRGALGGAAQLAGLAQGTVVAESAQDEVAAGPAVEVVVLLTAVEGVVPARCRHVLQDPVHHLLHGLPKAR